MRFIFESDVAMTSVLVKPPNTESRASRLPGFQASRLPGFQASRLHGAVCINKDNLLPGHNNKKLNETVMDFNILWIIFDYLDNTCLGFP